MLSHLLAVWSCLNWRYFKSVSWLCIPGVSNFIIVFIIQNTISWKIYLFRMDLVLLDLGLNLNLLKVVWIRIQDKCFYKDTAKKFNFLEFLFSKSFKGIKKNHSVHVQWKHQAWFWSWFRLICLLSMWTYEKTGTIPTP